MIVPRKQDEPPAPEPVDSAPAEEQASESVSEAVDAPPAEESSQ
jgi:hypothetical protein